ncbi:MAG: nucleoside triphosphate pyrophosphatase [Desulfocapsaceae bacterium]|nr:nucleoside triphosphate pyrophosphatase [Desulfocapsaceae bacterium]
MYQTRKPLILASRSPRRKKFLETLGLSFQITAADIEESRVELETPETFVERMAREKALAVGRLYPDAWILAADTIVSIDDTIFAKPQSKAGAIDMLLMLAGREHRVMTASCLFNQESAVEVVERACTTVRFSPFTERVARAYVQTGEPLDKAGGYGIQGRGGALVESICGSYSNVVGLPLAETLALLQRFDVIAVDKG